MGTDDHAEALSRHPLVAPLHADERAPLLASVRVRHVAEGATLVAVGDPPGPLLLVLEGTARLLRGDEEVARVGPGSWIGELALMEQRPARTHVVAAEPMVVGVVPAADAVAVLDVGPVAVQLDSLARRRRAANRAMEVRPVGARLRDGGEVTLRPVLASDWQALADGDGRVSERSLEMRFFVRPPLTERTFRRLTDVDLRREFAWAARVDGVLAGIGRHALQAEDRAAAELAVLVADDHQRRGVGALLVEAVAVAAAVHRADVLVAVARSANRPVQALLHRYGATFTAGPEDGVVVARWPVADAVAAITDRERAAALSAAAEAVLAPVLDV